MLAQGSLITFDKKKREARVDLIIAGEMYPVQKARPFINEELEGRVNPTTMIWSEEWSRPRRIKKLEGTTLKRFSGGKSLRLQGKERILGRLNLMSSEHIPGYSRNRAFSKTPQLPVYFPELSGFGDEPVGTNISASTSENVSRGIWGELQNTITKGIDYLMEIQKTKYTTKAAIEATKMAQAQASAAQAQYMTILQKPTEFDFKKYLPIIALAGGGLILFTILSKKDIKQIKKGGK